MDMPARRYVCTKEGKCLHAWPAVQECFHLSLANDMHVWKNIDSILLHVGQAALREWKSRPKEFTKILNKNTSASDQNNIHSLYHWKKVFDSFPHCFCWSAACVLWNSRYLGISFGGGGGILRPAARTFLFVLRCFRTACYTALILCPKWVRSTF